MSDTDPRRTRQLINALGYEAGSWKALSTALRIAQFGAGADWLDDELLAVELDLRKNHQIDDPADYRETYTGGDVGPVWSLDGLTEEDEPVSCEVQGRTPRLFVVQGDDILGEGETAAEACASANAYMDPEHPYTPDELYKGWAPHEQADLPGADPVYLARREDGLDRSGLSAGAWTIDEDPAGEVTDMILRAVA